jgi:N-acyl-D-amino-acid deacylase
MAAERFAITDRGYLREGAFADIVVMHPDRLVEHIDPPSYASGVDDVLVNGIQVVRAGESTGARPGRTLRPH